MSTEAKNAAGGSCQRNQSLDMLKGNDSNAENANRGFSLAKVGGEAAELSVFC